MRRTKGRPAVGAAHEHHVGRASPARHHTVQHVNVVVSRAAGVVNREEGLADYAAGINRAKIQQAATKVNSGVLVKGGVWPPICALLERTQRNPVPPVQPPTNTLPLVSTSRVPHSGEFGITTGLCQVTPPFVER